MKRATLCAKAVTLAVFAASAQAASPTSGSDAGPFPPEIVKAARDATPPVVITAPGPTNDQGNASNANAPRAAAMPARPAPVLTPAERQRLAERDLDRAEREGEKARTQAASQPAPVSPGAYDGTTSEQNR